MLHGHLLIKKMTMKPLFTSIVLLLICATPAFNQTILAEHHFESADITKVSIDGTFCNVYVTKGDKVVFDGLIKGKGDSGDYLIASMKSGHAVVFKVERKKEKRWDWNGTDLARLDVVVPDGIELIVNNTSGDVKVTNFKGNRLSVGTTSGNLELSGVRCDASVKTTSGDMSLKDMIGDVTMRSTSGDQKFYGINGNVQTRSTSGGIVIAKLKGDLDVEATSGDLKFDEIEGKVDVSTTSGSIEGDYVLLTGDSRMKSTSGNISFDFKNDIEELSFDLKASSGDLRIQNKEEERRLVVDRGGFKVTGVSSSGNQIYQN